MMNKNHSLQTRRRTKDHYQIVVINVQSGKCLRVLCDAVKDADMSATEFKSYVDGMYQGFAKRAAGADIVNGILRNEWY